MTHFRRIWLFVAIYAFFASPHAGYAAEESDKTPVLSDAEAEESLKEAKALEEKWLQDNQGNKSLLEALTLYQKVSAASKPDSGNKNVSDFGRARCLARMKRYWEAHTATEASYPAHFDPDAVRQRIKLQYSIAKLLMDIGKDVVEISGTEKKNLTGYDAASMVFAAIVYNDPHDEGAPQALLLQGDCLMAAGRFADAETAYRKVIRHYPKSPQAARAHASLAHALVSKAYPGGRPREVELEVEQLLLDCESARKLDPEVDRRMRSAIEARDGTLAGEILENARFHLRRGTKRDRNAALFLLQDLKKKYPETEAASTAGTLLRGLGVEPEGQQK